jgi:hypothetical protein
MKMASVLMLSMWANTPTGCVVLIIGAPSGREDACPRIVWLTESNRSSPFVIRELAGLAPVGFAAAWPARAGAGISPLRRSPSAMFHSKSGSCSSELTDRTSESARPSSTVSMMMMGVLELIRILSCSAQSRTSGEINPDRLRYDS